MERLICFISCLVAIVQALPSLGSDGGVLSSDINNLYYFYIGEDPEESLNLSDVWSYFEQESEQTACCVVCRTDVNHNYDELKAHLQMNHPKLLLQIMQDNDQNSDDASNADDNETYTEIVYLEQDPQVETSQSKHTVKNVHKFAPKSPKKRQRVDSDVEEHPIKKKKEDTDELGAFLQYISILLKKLPQDVFSKVQIEIINTILKANSESRLLNSELNSANSGLNVISVSEVSPINIPGHNYTITVGTTKPNETDNVS